MNIGELTWRIKKAIVLWRSRSSAGELEGDKLIWMRFLHKRNQWLFGKLKQIGKEPWDNWISYYWIKNSRRQALRLN